MIKDVKLFKNKLKLYEHFKSRLEFLKKHKEKKGYVLDEKYYQSEVKEIELFLNNLNEKEKQFIIDKFFKDYGVLKLSLKYNTSISNIYKKVDSIIEETFKKMN